jgi:hypothetical protein
MSGWTPRLWPEGAVPLTGEDATMPLNQSNLPKLERKRMVNYQLLLFLHFKTF